MPQQTWSDKRERQYEHIKGNELERGRSPRRAKEIAARTVNKTRRRHGETAQQRGRASGGNRPLEARRKSDLYNRARQLGIAGRSRMSKAELVRAIRSASSN